MLDIKRFRENADEVREGLAAKKQDPAVVDQVLELDARRRALLTDVEKLKNERKTTSKDIGRVKKEGGDIAAVQLAMRELGDRIDAMDNEVREVEDSLQDIMLRLPNIPYAKSPRGHSEEENIEVRVHGQRPEFSFTPKSHIELGEILDVLDMKRAAKMSGSGFALFKKEGARLVRALINFMLDLHLDEHGYTEVFPPVLCSAEAMTGTGQLPKMEEDMYRLRADELYLVPTAEVPVTNVYMQEIIEEPLPLYLTAYTPCFRREAGAAGKDTRGLIRLHQFDKVEMVKFVEPQTSYDELESLVQHAEDVLQRLGLHYRVIELCTGDLSFAAARCYDIELWAPGQDGWLEVSSCSNFEDFQARRANIRYRAEDGKPTFVHTLNGSGVALPRLVVALLECGQQEDGSVVLPEALVPYMNGISVLKPVT
jgi:seryl-tRNA synthetase